MNDQDTSTGQGTWQIQGPAQSQADRLIIDPDNPEDVGYWISELKCTDEQLRAAVRIVGTNAADVRTHLGPHLDMR